MYFKLFLWLKYIIHIIFEHSEFFSNNFIKIACGLRLGSTLCHPHKCICGVVVEANGRHGLSCNRQTGRYSRHAQINETFGMSVFFHLNQVELWRIQIFPPGLPNGELCPVHSLHFLSVHSVLVYKQHS